MDGTRMARTVALIAALLLGAALVGATLVSVGPRDGLHEGSGTTVLTTRTSLVRHAVRQENADVAPRTTPPPTLQAPSSSAPAASLAPAPATTVPHS